MYQRYVLSHSDAMKIISLIQAELEKQGKGGAVTVCDEHGELIAFVRTDGCILRKVCQFDLVGRVFLDFNLTDKLLLTDLAHWDSAAILKQYSG